MVTTSERASRSKLEAMLQNLYTKTTQVILQARVPITSSKENKWFCLNTPHLSKVQSELRQLHCAIPQALDGATLPPLVILITLPLHLLSLDERRHLLGNTTPPRGKTTLVIEAWTVTLKSAPFAKMDLPRFYKHAIAFFRSLYSLVRLLPAYHWLTTTTRPLAYRMGLADLYHEHEIPMASPTPPHATRPSYQSHALAMTTPIG
ncbi:autophagy-related protein 13-domain-containing protein [Gongronella butleri]|nr:autophagy-related protein 13-domain-containing protein [Gongronella butleri]